MGYTTRPTFSILEREAVKPVVRISSRAAANDFRISIDASFKTALRVPIAPGDQITCRNGEQRNEVARVLKRQQPRKTVLGFG